MTKAIAIGFALFLATLSGAPLAADSALIVEDAYVRMPPPGARVGAAFMVIGNPTGAARKLVRAQSPAAKVVELHTHRVHDGYMQMRKVDAIDIAAAGRVELKPGAYHLMLIDLKTGSKEGDTIPITLFFDDGKSKRIAVPLRRDVVPTRSGETGVKN